MGLDKIWEALGDGPLLSHSLRRMAACPRVEEVVLVVSSERLSDARALVERLHLSVRVCSGGEQRRDSVEAGLGRLEACEWVVVHDAARPFLTDRMIEAGLEAARIGGAAVAAVPAKDTIKRVDNLAVVETLQREELWLVQTPQVFRASLLRSALASSTDSVTDEATLVERMGGQVRVFAGEETNLKVTTPPDLELARAWLAHLSIEPGVASSAPPSTVARATQG